MLPLDHLNNEMFGEEALNLGIIAGAVFLLLATVWTSATPPAAAARASTQPAERVVVVGHRGRVS